MKSNTIKWLYAVPEKKKVYILFLMLLQFVNGGTGVFYALFLRNIVDSAVASNMLEFKNNILFVILLVVFQIFLRAVIRWINELSRAKFENTFKNRMMKNILSKDYEKVCAIHSGEWINRLTNDTTVIAKGYVEILPGIVGMMVKIISAAIMICIIDFHFALIIIPAGVLLTIVTYFLRKRIKKLHKEMQEKDGKLRVFFQDYISNLLMVHSFASEKQVEIDADKKMEEHKKARMRKNHFSNICSMGLGFSMNSMYLIGIIYCTYGILKGSISYGTLTAVTQLITQIQSPFSSIANYLPRIYSMLASAERLMEIEKFDDSIDKEPYDYSYIKDYYNNKLKRLEILDVSYTYYKPSGDVNNITKERMPRVINNASLTVNKGETVALIGKSGCGKSTILKILMSVYKIDSGTKNIIDIDDNKEELTSKWRRLFAYVPQGNGIMSGTIRDIVCFSDEDSKNNIERINNALKVACAYDFVTNLKDGVDTELGEKGLGISEGQMQRIAIARAIYSDSPILILDEATSSLDLNTEKQLLINLKQMTDKTVIIVTHHKAVMEECGRMYEIDETGIHEK